MNAAILAAIIALNPGFNQGNPGGPNVHDDGTVESEFTEDN